MMIIEIYGGNRRWITRIIAYTPISVRWLLLGSVSLPVRIPRAPPSPFTFTLALPPASFHLRRRTKSAPFVLKEQGVQSTFHLFSVVC